MTISQLARKHGLSRSTLLYYDRLGVLKPTGRLENGYRFYTESDGQRLSQVRVYRQAGIPLAEIRRVLGGPRKGLAAALELQLHEAGAQIEALRRRQRAIVDLLQRRRMLELLGNMDKDRWVGILRSAGLTGEDMAQWHRDFERGDARYHQRFLEFLGLPAKAIRDIRSRSRHAHES